MLNQNWFYDKKFVMFNEYFDTQWFFDTESKSIYVVSELDNGNIQILEHNGKEKDVAYPNLYEEYEMFVRKNAEAEKKLICDDLFVAKETVYTDLRSPYDDKLIFNEEGGWRYERDGRIYHLAEGMTFGTKSRKTYAVVFAIDFSYPTEGDKTKAVWWSMDDNTPKELLENCREYIK